MIVSHSKRFVFFAVPKTGTHAVRELLASSMLEGDWEQQALFEQKRIPIPEIEEIQHGHISVMQIRPHLSEKQWRDYFKFAIVRNPFDRFISVCFFLNRQNPDFQVNSLQWMKDAIRRERFQQRVLVRPQYQQLVDTTGQIAMDYVGRYENLQASMDYICDSLSVREKELSIKNSSEHEIFDSYYDDELRALVKDFYAKDFDYFSYT